MPEPGTTQSTEPADAASRHRDDRALVAACIEGDEDAWREIVHRYARLVYAITSRYDLDAGARDDAFQEVFAVLVRKLAGIRRESGLPKWLITTSHRVCRKHAAQLRRARGGSPHAGEAAAPSPTDDVLRWEEHQRVRDALERLGGRCRELLLALYASRGPVSYEQVARRLGIPTGSIGPTRARCLRKLMAILDETDETEGGAGI